MGCELKMILLAYTFSAGKMVILNTPQGRAYELLGSVRVEDRGTVITARRGIYYEETELSLLFGDALVKGPDYEMSGDTIRYSPRELLVQGNARLEDRHRVITSERVYSVGDSAWASGRVEIYLKKKRITLLGDSGVYDLKEKSGKLLGPAEAVIAREETVRVQAWLFRMIKDTLWAEEGVRARSPSWEAEGKRMAGVSEEGDTERITHVDSCKITWAEGWGSADTVRVLLVRGRVRKLELAGSAWATRKEGEASLQLKADAITLIMDEEGRLRWLKARGAKEGVYSEGPGSP